MIKKFDRNNLDKASSPYLQQHKNNPIFWQEWSSDIPAYAQQHNKPILMSVGYATCHWCHIMATDTFQDQQTAAFLNEHFINIKVDREQRPDIDQYLMGFTIASQGGGGWPLHVILTAELKPFAAFTYLPKQSQEGLPSFLEVVQQVRTFYQTNKEAIPPYTAPKFDAPDINPPTLFPMLASRYDVVNGGFGTAPKFPAYTTLLFLLHYFEKTNDQNVYGILKKTLDAIALGGLHDHLQGGFFRYAIDTAWTLPHFEKMLYDQALALWTYSVAYKVLKIPSYKTVAEKLIDCLSHTFEQEDGFYYAALSADSDDEEGFTYLWSYAEIKKALTEQEFIEFQRVYAISESGMINGLNHLIKTRDLFIPTIEQKLLALRNKRPQPFIDKKIITGWNALTGIGLIMAYRCLDNAAAFEKAQQLFTNLEQKHIKDTVVYHSSINNQVQQNSFLQDYASVLLFATYLMEETQHYNTIAAALKNGLQRFYHDSTWYEAQNTDFLNLPAVIGDQSVPSSVALAQYALARMAYLTNTQPAAHAYKEPLLFDFMNLCAFITHNAPIIQSPQKIEWHSMPVNAIQYRGSTLQACIGATCTPFKSIDELINALKV